jgi:erythromycin esterase
MRRVNRLSPYEDIGSLADRVRDRALPLGDPATMDALMDRIGDARFVLLGEASHGTADYYIWRAGISRRLIEAKGFSFIAIEGDWPDCYRVNRYVKGHPNSGGDAREVLHAYERWPTWMWANEEVVALAEWLRRHNEGLPEDRKAGFYGLDVYSLWDSLYQIMGYLQKKDPSALAVARRAYQCFEPFGEDVQAYARATAFVPSACEDEVIDLLRAIRGKEARYQQDGREGYFNAEQNALVLKNAESYYRAMIRGGPDSWNVRDRHMEETLDRLVRHHGPGAKAIVWAHNTHIGDARYTDMVDDGMVNLGQLARERYGEGDVVLTGFGSHRGTVIAGREWEAPMERLRVPPARAGSWEDVFHQAGPGDKVLLFDEETRHAEEFLRRRGHRAIGVVYRPEYEHFGNYVPTILPRRYDAYVYVDETAALHPLHMQPRETGEVPETYPSGL